MIPILMVVFALGGTTFGMAEESLAFYALIITVMIAAGYDSLVGAAILLLGCGIGVLGSTDQPVRDRHRLRLRRRLASARASSAALVILVVGTAIGIWFVMRYAAKVKADPRRRSLGARPGRDRRAVPRRGATRRRRAGATLTGAPDRLVLRACSSSRSS